VKPDAAVPALLAARMEELLRAHQGYGTSRAQEDAMLDAAIDALGEFVQRDPAHQSALDLLAIDALVTGAFAGVIDAAHLEALATRARDRLLALGDGPA
jgi:cytochrome c-type biogenesis protein CcmH/NrfG